MSVGQKPIVCVGLTLQDRQPSGRLFYASVIVWQFIHQLVVLEYLLRLIFRDTDRAAVIGVGIFILPVADRTGGDLGHAPSIAKARTSGERV